MSKASFSVWHLPPATAIYVALLCNLATLIYAESTSDDLLAAMRFNDTLLKQCVFKAETVSKILPVPKQPIVFEVIIADGMEITELAGYERLFELSTMYGTQSGISLDDIPSEYLPLVKLIRNDKIHFKKVENTQPDPITHQTYGYFLAQYQGDVAMQKYGGDHRPVPLILAVTSLGNAISSIEYFSGNWECNNRVSKYPVNLVHERALWYNFALGIGFGDRIQSLSIKDKRDDLYVVDAKISIWPGKIQDAQLLIDEEGIVRKADVQCNTRLIRSVSSPDSMTTEIGTKIASSGRVEAHSPSGRERFNRTIHLSESPSSITPEDFAKLCDLSIP